MYLPRVTSISIDIAKRNVKSQPIQTSDQHPCGAETVRIDHGAVVDASDPLVEGGDRDPCRRHRCRSGVLHAAVADL